MKLNSQIIKEDLSDICIGFVITGDVMERRLRFPALYHGETVPLDDRIYLVTADSLPTALSLEHHPSFICVGSPPKELLSGSCDLILVDENVVMEQLLIRVLEIFEKYNDWENDLREVIIKNEPIRNLGVLSDPIFENPIFMYDINLEYVFAIFNTHRYELPTDYHTLDDYFRLDLETINTTKLQSGFAEMAESKLPVIFFNEFYAGRTLTQNIFYDEQYIGRVYVDELNRTLSDKDVALIGVLADSILSSMLHNGSLNFGRIKDVEEMLINLLSCNPVDEHTITFVLDKLGWNIHDEFFCLIIEPGDVDRSGKVLAFLMARLSVVMSSRCYAQFDGKIIFVLNLTSQGRTQNDLMAVFKPILRDSLMKAGISTVFTDFKNLYHYYRQTCIALEIGQKKESNHWYHRFDDYILDYLLNSCTTELIPDALYPEGLRRLKTYDAQKGTRFTETLRVYLEEGMNIAECTRKLFIHRNTFLYRLERINKILNMDLNDSHVRLLLSIILQIVE